MSAQAGNRTTPKRPWIGFIVIGLVVVAATGLGASSFLLSRWSRVETASPSEADRAFAEAITAAGGGSPYMGISDGGRVLVHRELERPEPVTLATLHLVAWDPDGAHLARVDLPFWFVRLKMSETFNLGTLTSALARDWEHMDLPVSEKDLERRGPGIVLDHTLADGKRILLWTD